MRSRSEVVTYINSDNSKVSALPIESKMLEILDRCYPNVSISVGTESGNKIQVTIQLKQSNDVNFNEKTVIHFWISTTAAGAECTTAPNGGVSIDTGTLLKTLTSSKQYEVLSDVYGKAVIGLTDSGTPTFYVNVVYSGGITSSSAITFA